MQSSITIAVLLGLVLVASGAPVNQENPATGKIDAPLPKPEEANDKPESDKPVAPLPEEAKDQEQSQKPNPTDAPSPKPKEGKDKNPIGIVQSGM